MKKIVYLILFLLLPACGQAVDITPQKEVTAMPTSPCSNFSISSQKVNGRINIEIALPQGYEDSSDKEYNSIYLLDANYFFDDAPGTLDYLLKRGKGMTNIVQGLTDEGKIPLGFTRLSGHKKCPNLVVQTSPG